MSTMMRSALALALLLCACGDKPGPAGPAAPRDLGEALERASPSVYLVLMQAGSGAGMTEAPIATAFVVAPDRLATNAHVAETFDALGDGGRLVVRSSGTAPRDVVVTGAELHPGYVEFQRAWLDQLPIRRGPKGEAVAIPPLLAADVALLKVAADAGLAPPLPLASAEELAGLAGGGRSGLSASRWRTSCSAASIPRAPSRRSAWASSPR